MTPGHESGELLRACVVWPHSACVGVRVWPQMMLSHRYPRCPLHHLRPAQRGLPDGSVAGAPGAERGCCGGPGHGRCASR
jgi:hypothetical protein